MNNYFKNKFKDVNFVSEDGKKELLEEAEILSNIGVESDEDFRDAFYIRNYVRSIAQELSGKQLNKEDLSKVSASVMENRDKFPINSIFNFYCAVVNALNDAEIPIKKKAYPYSGGIEYIPPQRNRTKWVQSMKDIYIYSHQVGRNKAFEMVTKDWDENEKQDFKRWMSYYESGDHAKYKIAQKNYMEVGNGAFLPMNDLKSSLPQRPPPDPEIEQQKKQTEQDKIEAAQREIYALIGRLNSAERIATKTDAIKGVLGPEGFKIWLNALHTIKREIQTASISNVRSAKITSRDLIIKRANILEIEGHILPSKLMHSIAQVAPPPLDAGPTPEEMAGEMPEEGAPEEGAPEEGAPEGAEPDGMPEISDMPEMDGEAGKAMQEFLDNLSGKSTDEFDVDDNYSDDLYVTEHDLVATAQKMPLPAETARPIETISGGDHVEDALKNITVEDVIEKLESLSHIYGNRELARQLNIVDLMLGRLGIASYFPSLAEAMRSALDSNQYVLTRIEDIISKLRSSHGDSNLDLNEPSTISPETTGLKQSLEQDKAEEEAKKERRKVKEEAKLQPPPEPPPAPAQELAGPANVEGV